MAVDLLTWVCEKLTNNAPHAANGLADFVADRVLAGDRENYRAVIILQATERYHRTQ